MSVYQLLNFVLAQKMTVLSATLSAVVFQKTIPQTDIPNFVIELSKATSGPVPRDFILHTKTPQIYKVYEYQNDSEQLVPENFLIFQPILDENLKLTDQIVTIPISGNFMQHPFIGNVMADTDVRIKMIENLHRFICENFGTDPHDDALPENFVDGRWQRADRANVHQTNASILLYALNDKGPLSATQFLHKFTMHDGYHDWVYVF